MVDDVKITHIESNLNSIGNGQMAIENINDSDLGYRMQGFKIDGAVQKLLSKDKPGKLESIILSGSTTVGETGILKHDASGVVTGGQMTVTEFNTLISNGGLGVTGITNDGGTTEVIDQVKLIAGQNMFIDKTISNDGFVFSSIVEQVSYFADSVTLTTGTYVSGNVASTHVPGDDDDYVVQEVTGVPGFDIIFDYINVVAFDKVVVRLKYDGVGSHTPAVQIYNYDTTSWESLGTFTLDVTYQTLDYPILVSSDYVNGSNQARLRLYHTQSGIASHDISIDYIAFVRNNSGGSSLVRPQDEIIYGTGTGVSSTSNFKFINAQQALLAGATSVISGDYGASLGYAINVAGNYSHGRGNNVSIPADYAYGHGSNGCYASDDYARVYGSGTRSIWKGARHFSGGELDGDYSSQCMDGMTLLTVTTDDSVSTLTYSPYDSISPLYCPDGTTQIYTVTIFAASASGTESGTAAFKFRVIVYRDDPNFNGFVISALSGIEIIHIAGTTNWQTEFNLISSGYRIAITEDDTNNAINIRVNSGLSTTTVNWQAHISNGIQLKTNYYNGGSS